VVGEGAVANRIKYDKGQTIRGLGWSEDEKLLVIAEDGTVRCYSDLQGEFTQFSLGHVPSPPPTTSPTLSNDH
jgi:hypothetical protein